MLTLSFTTSSLGKSALILSALRPVDSLQGRTKVQKIVYLANLCGWNSIQDYRYYNYGPYSDTVATQLEDYRKNGWVEEMPFSTADGKLTYSYSLTKPGQRVAESLAAKMDNAALIKRTLSLAWELQKYPSADLEIMATLVYLRTNERISEDEQLVSRVAELKPKFTSNQIRGNLKIFNILRNFGYSIIK